MSDDLTPRQREYLDALPQPSYRSWGDAVGSAQSSTEEMRRKINDRSDAVQIEKVDGQWRNVASDVNQQSDADSLVNEDDPDPDDLTDREATIVRELQTAASREELADKLDEAPNVVDRYLDTIEAKGWEVYHDDEADLFEINGDHTLRSSEHKGTRTRKANRWWEVRHNALQREWKRIDPPTVETRAREDHEDWVTHVTDLHSGDLVRGYDDSVVHQTEDLPPIVDHITKRSIALSRKHGSDYDTAWLLWGGDFVTNEGIYEGQHENLDAWLDEQVATLEPALKRQIKAFSEEFDNVIVVGQAGNHGDIRANGSSKQANADILLYQDLRNTFGALAEEGICDNVEFRIGRAGSPTPFWMRDGEIHGQLRHGQDRKPQATTSAKKKEWLSTVIDSMKFGKPVDLIWMGHYHVSGIVPWNGPKILVTASPLPVGEYPRKLGEVDAVDAPDIATCHGVSDDGMTGYYPIDPRHYDPDEYVTVES